MRILPFLLLLPLAVFPARAQTDAPAAHHKRLTWEQRFEQANDTHDGHLTLAQAKTGYKTLVRHFQEIDTGSKGFVTEDDIRAWHKQQRAARHNAHTSSDDNPRPSQAFQRTLPGQHPYDDPSSPPQTKRPDASDPSAAPIQTSAPTPAAAGPQQKVTTQTQ